MQAFKNFTKCMNLVFPARQALDFMSDYNALAEINVLAGKHFRDERLSMKAHTSKASCDYRPVSGIEEYRSEN